MVSKFLIFAFSSPLHLTYGFCPALSPPTCSSHPKLLTGSCIGHAITQVQTCSPLSVGFIPQHPSRIYSASTFLSNVSSCPYNRETISSFSPIVPCSYIYYSAEDGLTISILVCFMHTNDYKLPEERGCIGPGVYPIGAQ